MWSAGVEQLKLQLSRHSFESASSSCQQGALDLDCLDSRRPRSESRSGLEDEAAEVGDKSDPRGIEIFPS